jgi:hypothetical protein
MMDGTKMAAHKGPASLKVHVHTEWKLHSRYTSQSSVQHTQLTAQRYTTQAAYRFGHQKSVLTTVLLKMGIIMLETC